MYYMIFSTFEVTLFIMVLSLRFMCCGVWYVALVSVSTVSQNTIFYLYSNSARSVRVENVVCILWWITWFFSVAVPVSLKWIQWNLWIADAREGRGKTILAIASYVLTSFYVHLIILEIYFPNTINNSK